MSNPMYPLACTYPIDDDHDNEFLTDEAYGTQVGEWSPIYHLFPVAVTIASFSFLSFLATQNIFLSPPKLPHFVTCMPSCLLLSKFLSFDLFSPVLVLSITMILLYLSCSFLPKSYTLFILFLINVYLHVTHLTYPSLFSVFLLAYAAGLISCISSFYFS